MKRTLLMFLFMAFLPLVAQAAVESYPNESDVVEASTSAPAHAPLADDEHAAAAGHASADAHAEEGHTSGLPQLDPTWYPSQIFWLTIMFTIMYLYFSKRLLPTIAETIENREQHIKNDLLTAEQLTHEAEKIQKLYEQGLTDARSKATAAHQDIEEQTRLKSEQMQADFNKDADKRITDIKARIDNETVKAKKDIEEQISSISALAAEQIAGIKTNAKDVKLVVQSLNDNKKAEAA